MSADHPALTRRDFDSGQMIRWCPGCGDYAILSSVQTVFADLGLRKEEVCLISGIGCNARFPYYMDTYGFHTIHGRAPTVATGLKVTRPELSVWVITGDGDALSIGGNHLIHTLRRNVDLNILLFNNRIYGLTKGQYSPTSELGKTTKSSPMGSIDAPFEPAQVALGANGSFVARTIDVLAKHLQGVLKAAHAHSGTSFVEIYQNCNIFNDGAFASFTDKGVRDDRLLFVEHGEPLVWGKAQRRGLVLDGLSLVAVDLADDDDGSDCMRHDERNPIVGTLLATMSGADMPVAIGILHRSERPTYDSQFVAQVSDARIRLGDGDLAKLLHSGDTWTVK